MSLQNVDKKRVRDDLVAHLSAAAHQDDDEVAMRRRDAAPISDDEHRADDVSHQDEAGDVHALFEEVDDLQQALIQAAQMLDIAPKTTVTPGAVIELDGERCIIGVASDEFTSGDSTYIGISTQAPIYAAIEGKASGQSVEFTGRSVTLGDIV